MASKKHHVSLWQKPIPTPIGVLILLIFVYPVVSIFFYVRIVQPALTASVLTPPPTTEVEKSYNESSEPRM